MQDVGEEHCHIICEHVFPPVGSSLPVQSCVTYYVHAYNERHNSRALLSKCETTVEQMDHVKCISHSLMGCRRGGLPYSIRACVPTSGYRLLIELLLRCPVRHIYSDVTLPYLTLPYLTLT